jgi:hypothetical protein
MPSVELTGEITHIGDLQTFANNFHKVSFRLLVSKLVDGYSEPFVDEYTIELTKNQTSLIDVYKVGQHVKVYTNLRSRKWEKDGKVATFMTLNCWKIENLADVDKSNAFSNDNEDDLPF